MPMSKFEIESSSSTFKEVVFLQPSAKCCVTAPDSLGPLPPLSLDNHRRKWTRRVKKMSEETDLLSDGLLSRTAVFNKQKCRMSSYILILGKKHVCVFCFFLV